MNNNLSASMVPIGKNRFNAGINGKIINNNPIIIVYFSLINAYINTPNKVIYVPKGKIFRMS
jgi:hypothetical protein